MKAEILHFSIILFEIPNSIQVGGDGEEGGRQKSPPPSPLHTSFSSVTSTKVGINAKNVSTFTFDPFSHWFKISRSHLVPVSNYGT